MGPGPWIRLRGGVEGCDRDALSAKLTLIAAARDHTFEVFAEVGSKDPGEPARPEPWLEEARRDIDSGACWLVAEGRESGTVGLYTADGW